MQQEIMRLATAIQQAGHIVVLSGAGMSTESGIPDFRSAKGLWQQGMQLEELVTAFGERGFGALFLFLGLLSLVIGWIPGSTTILGIPMLLLAVQLVFRRNEPWLPRSRMPRW